MEISKKSLIDSINNCQSIEQTMEERVKHILEITDDWNESCYREYHRYVQESIDGVYGEELTDDEKEELYNKVMERV